MNTTIRSCACALVASMAVIAHADIPADMIYASSVEHFDQGLTNNGSSVDASRSDASNALGAPQTTDTLNFVSLGFEGEMILSFETRFGTSLSIWETTYGNPANYPEAADVFVGTGSSFDTAQWAFVDTLANTNDSTPMSLANAADELHTNGFDFVRIVDATDRSIHNGSADGFDVDGVGSYAAASSRFIPTPGSVSLAGLGLLLTLTSRKRG